MQTLFLWIDFRRDIKEFKMSAHGKQAHPEQTKHTHTFHFGAF